MFAQSITRRGKKNLTREYKAWRDEAGWLARVQLVGVPEIMCRFNVEIEVPISWRDTDNWIKPLLDLCQRIHAVSNDGNQHEPRVTPTNRKDCKITLTPLPEMGRVRKPAKVL